MDSNAAGLVLRPALKTGFSEMGWGSTPLLSALEFSQNSNFINRYRIGDSMYYTVYKITNKINGKFYIGTHKTKRLDDNYAGSGKYLKHAQEKYGIENFSKEILFVYDNAEEMYAKEADIVNEEFLAEENTYNLKLGGYGGFDYLNDWKENPTHSKDHLKKMSDSVHIDVKRNSASKALEKYVELIAANGGKQWFDHPKGFLGKQHSDETIDKIKNSLQGHGSGDKNSQFGTIWITNGSDCKKIKSSSEIPHGWRKGRK
jgi:group I intron endonuclease